MDAQLRVFEFKTKDGDNDIIRYAVANVLVPKMAKSTSGFQK